MNTTSPATEEPVAIYCPGPAGKSGGIRAAWHLEIVTGKDASALLEMQNQAIIDLLTWAAEHEKTAGQNAGGGHNIRANDSRETFGLAA
jgi:hypothetical protein